MSEDDDEENQETRLQTSNTALGDAIHSDIGGPSCNDSSGGSISSPSFSSLSLLELSSANNYSSGSVEDSGSCIPSSPDIQSFLGPPPSLQSELKSFKIVGDNLDKHVQPRDMRSDYQARSLHFFHSYAVQDRIQSESYSESIPPIDPANVNFSDLLPTSTDDTVLKRNMAIMVARILKKHMPFFAKYGSGIEKHISHAKYADMSQKSKVVSL